MLTAYFDRYATDYSAYKQGDWCYEDGCIYRGLTLLDIADPDGPWSDHLVRLVNAQIAPDGSLAGYTTDEFNIDNILSGRALMALHARTGDEKYRLAAERLALQLERHPRIPAGNYWHKLRYPHQVWLDGLYMGLPFQIEYGQAFDRPALIEDAIAQINSALDLLANPANGLYSHGYDDAREQQWADKTTGRSRDLWSRALGWLAMALVDIRELIGPQKSLEAGLEAKIADFAARMQNHQREDGRWNQVTDMPDLKGNYAESSATAMLAYFYLAGARLGIAGIDAAVGRKALDGLLEHAMHKDASGRLVLDHIVHVAGLGGFEGQYRDGTAGYYVSEKIAVDDSKGVGPLMMAVAETRRSEGEQGAIAKSA